jgi:hypothetical protein
MYSLDSIIFFFNFRLDNSHNRSGFLQQCFSYIVAVSFICGGKLLPVTDKILIANPIDLLYAACLEYFIFFSIDSSDARKQYDEYCLSIMQTIT